MLEQYCVNCGKLFLTKKQGKRTNINCSIVCRNIGTARKRKLNKYPLKVGECLFCKKDIIAKYSGMDTGNRKFCSYSCVTTYRNKTNNPSKNIISIQKAKDTKKKYFDRIGRKTCKENTNRIAVERRKVDIQFRLKCLLRSRLGNALKNNIKKGKTLDYLGCSITFLKQHLESKFTEGMTWETQGRHGWHIDHIIPLSRFDLSQEEEIYKAMHYTNLQPLWEADNIKKGNK